MPITPPYLEPGDSIGIISTARKINAEELQPSIQKFYEWGLKVEQGKSILKSHKQFAGTDKERKEDLQYMLDNPEIKAIVCARGGYGTVRIIDSIDFTKFIKSPKWIVGYSDVTVLHSHIHANFNIETIHGTMPINFPPDGSDNYSLNTLKEALFNGKLNYDFSFNPLSKPGKGQGDLVGGNLSILYSLSGTKSDLNTDGKILFIEDLDEYLYHIDRMMMNLKRCGKLENLAGLVVGTMSELKDNTVPYGKTALEIIKEAVDEYYYPVAFGFPAGHTEDNRAMILGRKMKLEVGNNMSLLHEY